MAQEPVPRDRGCVTLSVTVNVDAPTGNYTFDFRILHLLVAITGRLKIRTTLLNFERFKKSVSNFVRRRIMGFYDEICSWIGVCQTNVTIWHIKSMSKFEFDVNCPAIEIRFKQNGLNSESALQLL